MSINEITRVLTPFLSWSANNKDLPNTKVMVTFRSKYPKVKKIEWSRIDNGRWQVFFELNNSKNWVIYTEDADCLETTVAVGLSNLPSKVKEQFNTEYMTKSLQNIYKIQTSSNTIFELQLKNSTSKEQLVYDENGEMLGKMTTRK